ncbi:proline-rich receptor-like protein kinase PERK12 [Iris pallida]|uniref:Proline-rich receptor-like protein kinase PERK12 n=1 Tax=Iris pallida TaxID=29817 RepID=A0AAX6E865_IRIPA|nr:proline-rich receptor-like protein kinase PERK12 [Iris pallida]
MFSLFLSLPSILITYIKQFLHYQTNTAASTTLPCNPTSSPPSHQSFPDHPQILLLLLIPPLPSPPSFFLLLPYKPPPPISATTTI